jgi:hypothetical protein
MIGTVPVFVALFETPDPNAIILGRFSACQFKFMDFIKVLKINGNFSSGQNWYVLCNGYSFIFLS